MGDGETDNSYRHFTSGAIAIVPVLLGLVPYALIAGVVAVRMGLSPVEASGLSLVLFAGASQLAALELIHDGAPVLIVVITIMFVNLRLLMYSASIAPHFSGTSRRSRLLVSYLLTDQAYMFSLYGFERRTRPAARIAYYLGLALPMWIVWQLGTIAGALLGSGLPQGWGLDFALPLIFLALLVPSVRDRATLAAAVVGGGVAVVGHALPWNLGLIAGALAGIGAGVAISAASRRTEPSA